MVSIIAIALCAVCSSVSINYNSIIFNYIHSSSHQSTIMSVNIILERLFYTLRAPYEMVYGKFMRLRILCMYQDYCDAEVNNIIAWTEL